MSSVPINIYIYIRARANRKNHCGFFGMINFTIVAPIVFFNLVCVCVCVWGEGRQKYSDTEMNFPVTICTAIFSFLFFILFIFFYYAT